MTFAIDPSLTAFLDQAYAANEHSDPYPLPQKGLRNKVCDIAIEFMEERLHRCSKATDTEINYLQAMEDIYTHAMYFIDSIERQAAPS